MTEESAEEGDLESTVMAMLTTEYLKRMKAAEPELLGDLDNWKPTGLLGGFHGAP